MRIAQQNQSGKGSDRGQERRHVDDERPDPSCVTSLVKIIDHGNPAQHGLRQGILPCRAVDEGVRGIARSLEDDHTLALVDREVADGAANTVRAAQMFHDRQFVDRQCASLRGRRIDTRRVDINPGHIDLALVTATGGGSTPKPIRMIERNPGHTEEDDDSQSEHGEIDMQPASDSDNRSVPGLVRATDGAMRVALDRFTCLLTWRLFGTRSSRT